jgi:hypothetical protein
MLRTLVLDSPVVEHPLAGWMPSCVTELIPTTLNCSGVASKFRTIVKFVIRNISKSFLQNTWVSFFYATCPAPVAQQLIVIKLNLRYRFRSVAILLFYVLKKNCCLSKGSISIFRTIQNIKILCQYPSSGATVSSIPEIRAVRSAEQLLCLRKNSMYFYDVIPYKMSGWYANTMSLKCFREKCAAYEFDSLVIQGMCGYFIVPGGMSVFVWRNFLTSVSIVLHTVAARAESSSICCSPYALPALENVNTVGLRNTTLEPQGQSMTTVEWYAPI